MADSSKLNATLELGSLSLSMDAYQEPDGTMTVRLVGHTDLVVGNRNELIEVICNGKGFLSYFINLAMNKIIPQSVPEPGSNHAAKVWNSHAHADQATITITITKLTMQQVQEWFLTHRK